MRPAHRIASPVFWVVSCLLASPALAAGPATSAKDTVSIRRAGSSSVEITVTSAREFPVTNALVVLHIGRERSSLSRYPTGDLHTLTFTMSAAEFARTRDGDPIAVDYDPDSQQPWDFGRLDRSQVGM